MRRPIFQITYRQGLASVFHSQVGRVMRSVAERGYRVEVIVFASVGEFTRPGLRKKWKAMLEMLSREEVPRIRRIVSPPARFNCLWNEGRVTRICLDWLAFRLDKPIVLQPRGVHAANLVLDAVGGDPRFRVLYDCRGLTSHEFLYMRGYRDIRESPAGLQERTRALQRLECRAARYSDSMIVVSEAMKKRAISQWRLDERSVHVAPCGVDVVNGALAYSKRTQTRRMLGVSDRFVLAYCGSVAPWQLMSATIDLVKALLETSERFYLLVLTPDPVQATKLASAKGIREENRTVLRVRQTSVAEYLAAADIGLLLRERHAINEVASPVKFAEYLACGVPVAMSDGIGDYSQAVFHNQLGIVFRSTANVKECQEALLTRSEGIERSRLNIAEQCMRYARNYLDVEHGVEVLSDIYRTM